VNEDEFERINSYGEPQIFGPPPGVIPPPIVLRDVTRISVVTEREGLVFERYDLFTGGVELHLQDDGRTLKVFPRREESK
jgi:hypothetical protein